MSALRCKNYWKGGRYMNSYKDSFLATVLQHIKSKEAKDFVRMELVHHLSRSKAQLLAKGMSEAEAEERAVRQMGNPIELGKHFNKLHRPKTDWMLISLCVLAFAMGLLPLLNVQGVYAGIGLVSRRIMHIALALTVAIVMMLVDYRKLERYSWWFLGIGLGILVVLAYFPSTTIRGQPYMYIPGVGTISSDAALPFLCLFWASYFAKNNAKLWAVASIYLVTVYYYVSLPNLTASMIYSVVVLIMFLGSSIERRLMYTTVAAVCGLGIIAAFPFLLHSAPYQKERIFAFLYPEAHAQGGGFMYLKIKELMAAGGWFGTSSYSGYIPATAGELVLVNIAHYYGWIVTGLLVAVLILLLLRMTAVLRQTKTSFGRQLLIGVLTLFAVQYLYNIGMIAGFFPLTSITLPFVSYGFTSAILDAFLFGIGLSVCRRRHLVPVTSK